MGIFQKLVYVYLIIGVYLWLGAEVDARRHKKPDCTTPEMLAIFLIWPFVTFIVVKQRYKKYLKK